MTSNVRNTHIMTSHVLASNSLASSVADANTGAVDPTLSWPLKIYDAFTGANGTDLEAHTIAPTNVPGNSWVNIYPISGRAITIGSNRAVGQGWTSLCQVALETGASDFVVTAVLNLDDPANVCRLFVRLDTLDANISKDCWTVSFGNGILELKEQNIGVSTVRATANLTTNAGQEYHIRIACIGTTLTVTVGSTTISYAGATTHLTSTKVGMEINNGGSPASYVDDFKVFF